MIQTNLILRYGDELSWVNLWLYNATNQKSYLENAKSLIAEHEFLQENPKIFNVDTKVAAVQLLLAMEEGKDETKFFSKFESNTVFTAALASARSIKESDKTEPIADSSALAIYTTYAATSMLLLTVLFFN